MNHSTDASDAEVVVASRDDPPAFAAVFDRHAPDVHRYLDRRLGRDRADDLLGEVFRIAFERRHSYRPEHPVPARGCSGSPRTSCCGRIGTRPGGCAPSAACRPR
jgi:hypothetical protein